MVPNPARFMFPRPAESVELILRLPGGEPWTLTVSPGVERFIGFYPRLDGIQAAGPLLEFTRH